MERREFNRALALILAAALALFAVAPASAGSGLDRLPSPANVMAEVVGG